MPFWQLVCGMRPAGRDTQGGAREAKHARRVCNEIITACRWGIAGSDNI